MKIHNFCNLNYTSIFYRFKFLILGYLFFFYFINFSSCTSVTLGIDWGEEFVEASIAFRGHRPDILLTGTGSRKFENVVYLLGDTRLFDKEASSFALKDPSKTLQKSAHLLGIPFSSNSKWSKLSTLKASDVVETFKKNNVYFHWDYTPYEFGVSKDGQLHLKVLKDSMVGLEEATGHFFNHLKHVALEKLLSVKAIESFESEVEMLAVISIPCNYTQNQRKALVFAAESAGLKVVDLVHGITAAAWLNTLEMAPGTKKILYYDLGSSGANVGVVEAYVPQKNSKEHPKVKTLSCVTYPGIGGRQHDLLLAEYLRDKFESDNNIKLMPNNPRSLQKLLKTVNKAKMKLTLSETASVEVDNLVKNKHLNVKVTRSQYDKLLDPVLQQLHIPLNMALEQANLKLSDLDSVEMLGGAWRVPSVTSKLSQVVSPLQLGFHLNAEESIAMGCGYLAAAHNPFFRMKKVELSDNTVFDYVLHVKGSGLDKRVTLYKSVDKLNSSKTVKVNTENDFNITIYEKYKYNGNFDMFNNNNGSNTNTNNNNNNNLYYNEEVKVLDYKITGVNDLMMNQGKDRLAQVSLAFKTENGVIRLSKVSAKPVKKATEKRVNKTKYDLWNTDPPKMVDDTSGNGESTDKDKNDSKEEDKDEQFGNLKDQDYQVDEHTMYDDTVQFETDSTTDETSSEDFTSIETKESENVEKETTSSSTDSTKSDDKDVDSTSNTDSDKKDEKTTTDNKEELDNTNKKDENVKETTDSKKDDKEDDKVKETTSKDEDKKQDSSTTKTEDKETHKDTQKDTTTDKKEENKKSKMDLLNDVKKFNAGLKEKFLGKQTEDLVTLEFVNNTVELYHLKKLDESKKNIELLVNKDKAAIDRSNVKNKLESTLYKYKGALKSDDFKLACKPNEDKLLEDKVKTLLEWFDNNSYNAPLNTLNGHLEDLNKLGTPIFKRMYNNVNRELLVKTTNDEFNNLKEKLNKLLEEKPYLKEQSSTLDLFTKNIEWWDQVKTDQKNKPLYEDALFDSTSVKSKLDLSKMLLRNLQQIKPPVDLDKETKKDDKKEDETSSNTDSKEEEKTPTDNKEEQDNTDKKDDKEDDKVKETTDSKDKEDTTKSEDKETHKDTDSTKTETKDTDSDKKDEKHPEL